MKVLITGGAGFIGYHVAKKFVAEGHEVFCIDNFNDYYDVKLKYAREARLLNNHGIKVEKVDIQDADKLKGCILKNRPDMVIHLAASAGVRYSMEHAQEYIDNNITGTQNVIRACEHGGVDNVIYASTSCVMHGHPLPWGEVDALGPHLSPYGYTKATNESQFQVSNIENAVGLRFFTVYGPYGRPDMALFDFTKKILNHEEITVYNEGNMIRDFTYVDDIVQGIFLVANNMTNRDIYCIGYGERVKLTYFIKCIEKELGIDAKMKYEEHHPADALETWSDTDKLKKLGYNPSTPIEEGVKNFVKWYREFYN